jgi:hypothetical protein
MRRAAVGLALLACTVGAAVVVVHRASPTKPAASISIVDAFKVKPPVFNALCIDLSTDPTREWSVDYEVDFLPEKPTMQVARVTLANGVANGRFELKWDGDRGEGEHLVIGDAATVTGAVINSVEARLLTPDGACSLYLRAAGPSAPDGIAVVGDSVIAQLRSSVLADPAGIPAGADKWHIVGAPGEGWAATPGEGSGPESSSLNLVRGVLTERPDVLVLSFGANDAIRVLFASINDGAAAAEQARAETAKTFAKVLDEAARTVPCIVLVTPSNWPSNLFGGGIEYSWEARRLVQEIRAAAATRNDRTIAVVDWSALSISHHKPDGEPDDWFSDGDEVHTNVIGSLALARYIDDTVSQECPAAGK